MRSVCTKYQLYVQSIICAYCMDRAFVQTKWPLENQASMLSEASAHTFQTWTATQAGFRASVLIEGEVTLVCIHDLDHVFVQARTAYAVGCCWATYWLGSSRLAAETASKWSRLFSNLEMQQHLHPAHTMQFQFWAWCLCLVPYRSGMLVTNICRTQLKQGKEKRPLRCIIPWTCRQGQLVCTVATKTRFFWGSGWKTASRTRPMLLMMKSFTPTWQASQMFITSRFKMLQTSHGEKVERREVCAWVCMHMSKSLFPFLLRTDKRKVRMHWNDQWKSQFRVGRLWGQQNAPVVRDCARTRTGIHDDYRNLFTFSSYLILI